MKMKFFVLNIFFLSGVINAGIEEDTTRSLINLFNIFITSEYRAEVTNARIALQKGKVRPALNHLLIAGLHLKTEAAAVDLGDARVCIANPKSEIADILRLMVQDLLTGNEKAAFMDGLQVDLLKKIEQDIKLDEQ